MALRPKWTELASWTDLPRVIERVNQQMRDFFRELPDTEHRLRTRRVTAVGTLLAEDDFILFTTGGHVWNLPAARTLAGRRFSFKLWAGGAVTLTPNGAELIDGAATYVIAAVNDSVALIAMETAAGTWGWIVETDYP